MSNSSKISTNTETVILSRSSSSSGCRSPSCGEKEIQGRKSSAEKKRQGRKVSSAEKRKKEKKGSSAGKTEARKSSAAEEREEKRGKNEANKLLEAEKSQKWSQKGFKEVTDYIGGRGQAKQ